MPSRGPEFDPEEFKRYAREAGERLRESRKLIYGIVIVVLLIITGWSAYYQNAPEEVALIMRFGRYVRTTPPGLHAKLPFGIEQALKVPIMRQLKQAYGFRTLGASVEGARRQNEDTRAESIMLTGDLNVATVEWIVQYKISDPFKYLFKLRDVDETLRLMSEATMRSVVGDHSVTELLTVGREAIAARAKELLADMCRRYENGIVIDQLVLQNVDPPEPVRPSFNDVNQAIQERERAINEAWAEYNREIPRARGLAEQKIQAAEGYAVERVNQSKGDAQRFIALEEEYRKAPEVTRTRLYLETLAQALPQAGKKLIFDEKAKGILPLFPLGPMSQEGRP